MPLFVEANPTAYFDGGQSPLIYFASVRANVRQRFDAAVEPA